MVKSGLGRCRRPIRLGRWLLTSTGPAQFNFADPRQLPFLTKIPVDGSALSKNQGANWWRRGREHTKPDFGYEGVAMRDD